MIIMGERWIAVNDWNIRNLHRIQWEITGRENLDYNCPYLVVANHQSWVDIVVLQHVFNCRIPFMRFFLKIELFYVPIFGLVWWALDFPFMRRYSAEYLKKRPEKRGQDLVTTKIMVQRFRGRPVSILNFLEGTRFTPQKHAKQNSPYRHLLTPKVGGVAFVLQAMGEQFKELLDVTIQYPEGAPNLWQLLCGRCHKIVVNVRRLPIPDWTTEGNYIEDVVHRERMQAWVREIWAEKDKFLSEKH